MTVLVTGANGQLGMCIGDLMDRFSNLKFIFKSSSELDIINQPQVNQFFKVNDLDYVVNCAAYTNVDKAEEEPEKAYKVNVEGVRYLAKLCQAHNTILIHISTDFVFDGKKQEPYTEIDTPNPLNVYGKTKFEGEKRIVSYLDEYFIIRTSWLYSEYGHNFLKTMLQLSKKNKEISVVDDQVGNPTYAGDLAKVILSFIERKNKNFGIYHFSNLGQCSWYDFAKVIFEEKEIDVNLIAIKSVGYHSECERPKYSVLNTSRLEETFNIKPPNWKDSLKHLIDNIN